MDQGDALRRECLAYRASGSRGGKGEARFAPERDDARFRPRSAALTRHVACGFRAGKLARATEQFHLRLASQDRENPGFSTGNPNNSSRYYLVCEGSVRTSLAAFTAGQRLSFADNTFTLPCGHMIYPKGTSDPATASRVSGVYTYKVRSATLEVRRGPRLDHPSFTLLVDVVVVNPLETLELRGRVSGEISTAVAVVECGTGPRFTKQIPHPACG
jgi:hypothetical protein